MPINILMPALSPTMEKGNLAKWLKKEGEAVKPGDVIAEIETDKATMEVEAIDEGVLAKIVVPAGTTDVPVNQLIALLAAEGEDPKTVRVKTSGAPPLPQTVPQAPQVAPKTVSEAVPRVVSQVASSAATFRPQPVDSGRGRVFASPLAKRLANDAGIMLANIQGSGPHGRIVARDVETAKSGGAFRASAAGGVPAIASMSDDKIRALFEPGSYDVVPHDNIRKIIAKRLMEAKLTIPHFYLSVDCTIDSLLAARESINAAAPKNKDGKPAYKLSVNDFVIKALALALQKVPNANVTWTEGGMLKHKRSDVGVAVAIDGGLITPVVRSAESKSVSVISEEMRDLAARARARKLAPHEYQGGSTAISNLGMYGIKDFAAVINPPHATILAIGMGEKRAIVRDGQLGVATQMTVTLSSDHRAVDGAVGAEFIAAFKHYIENPVMMVV